MAANIGNACNGSNINVIHETKIETQIVTQNLPPIGRQAIEEPYYNKSYDKIQRKTAKLLIDAANNHHIRDLKCLIKEGKNVNAVDDDGKTALHHVAYIGYTDVVTLLMDNGATVNVVDSKDKTPLHLAAEKGHTEVVKSLLDNGARTNISDGLDMTPLKLAAYGGYTEVVELLKDNSIKLLE